jgi:hypothetical protein
MFSAILTSQTAGASLWGGAPVFQGGCAGAPLVGSHRSVRSAEPR